MKERDIEKKKKLICRYRKAMIFFGVLVVIIVLLYLIRELLSCGFEQLIEKIVTMSAPFDLSSAIKPQNI